MLLLSSKISNTTRILTLKKNRKYYREKKMQAVYLKLYKLKL